LYRFLMVANLSRQLGKGGTLLYDFDVVHAAAFF
jgi:hypothetical protein